MPPLAVYRWADGSTVTLEPARPGQTFDLRENYKFVVRIREGEKPSRAGVNLVIVPPQRLILSGSSTRLRERIEGPFRAKLLGFMLSLGIGRVRPWASGLIDTGSIQTLLKFPKFVDDHRLSDRYEEAETYWKRSQGWKRNKKDGFLGCVEGFTLSHVRYMAARHRAGRVLGVVPTQDAERDMHSSRASLVQISWHYDDLAPENGARVYRVETDPLPTLKEAVDQLVWREDIRPESERKDWIEKNAEFGTWVTPSSEEIEVFRILDEPLPFFWETRKLEEWIDSVS